MKHRYRYADNVTEEGVELTLELYREERTTPCGAWVRREYLGQVHGRQRFALNGAGRRHCHQTKALAWEAYKKRKLRQRTMAKDALAKAEYALEQLAAIDTPPDASLLLGQPEYWQYYIFD